MAVQNDIFDYVTSLLGVELAPQLTQGNSVACQLQGGRIEKAYLYRSERSMNILLLGKSTSFYDLINQMHGIINNLEKTKQYKYDISSIEPTSLPSFVTKEGDFFICSCVLSVRYVM